MPKNFEMLTKLSQTENWKEQVVYNLEGVTSRPDQKSVEKNRQKTKSMLRLQEDSR